MTTPKVCQVCKVEGRGNVTINQKAKKGNGEYWANPDGSPHYFAHGESSDGKVKFLHPRNWDEFKLCADGNPDQLPVTPSYKAPLTNSKPVDLNKQTGNDPDLTPGTGDKDGLIQLTIVEGNTAIKWFRKTAWDLAKDLNPNGTNHELRISASGFIHDFMALYVANKQAHDNEDIIPCLESIASSLDHRG
jgi:hypothetical protein